MSRIADELVDEVRAGLRAHIEDVFEACGAELRGRGRNRRTSTCPACGARSRWDAVRVSVERGWVCGCCGASGDAVKAVALFAGLDHKRDFAEVIRRGAELVGIDLEPPADPAIAAQRRRQYEQRTAARVAERQARDEAEAAERAVAIANAARWWPQLTVYDPRGANYLAERRGLSHIELAMAAAVRYGKGGDPAVALHDELGQVVNIVRRVIEPGDGPKTPGLYACPSWGTLVGRLDNIVAGSRVVVVEGVIDALTAVLAWPGAVVLGAHGVGNYGDIVRAAAARLVTVGGRLLMVFDNDVAGAQAVGESLEALADVELDPGLAEVVDIGNQHDLNDAWCAGWRP